MLTLQNVCAGYGGTEILHDISFTLPLGENLCILGPNGCGKTTLLRILGGFLDADEGHVIFDGEEISSKPPYERELNTVFQKYALFPHLSVYENIVLPLRLDGAEIDGEFLEEIVSLLGLDDKMERLPETLSGGQQQRAAIARALATKPAIILADEPTGNLDSKTSMDVILLMQSISKQFHQTTVMITHNEEIAQMADRTIRIEDGKVVSGGVQYAR